MSGKSVNSELDGRAQRSARSRERILDALAELVAEGQLHATGQQVAERAGISLRTVFRHFEDMDGLYREMHGRLREQIRPLAEGPPVEGDLATRVREAIRRRSAAFEQVAPFFRSGAIHRWHSEYLSEAHRMDTRDLRSQLAAWVPELETVPDGRREAIHLMTSFEAYDRLRIDQRLGRERAEDVVIDAVLRLLA